MAKYTSMTPLEAGIEFHRIFKTRDSHAMWRFIFDHCLDETDGLYVRDHARIPNGNFVIWRFLIAMADERKRIRYYVVEKKMACTLCVKGHIRIYELIDENGCPVSDEPKLSDLDLDAYDEERIFIIKA